MELDAQGNMTLTYYYSSDGHYSTYSGGHYTYNPDTGVFVMNKSNGTTQTWEVSYITHQYLVLVSQDSELIMYFEREGYEEY